MFWAKKTKGKKAKKAPAQASGQKPADSPKLREQAMANMKAARAHLGDETIAKIAELMEKKQNSPIEKAKSDIASADADRVADEILWMLDQKNKD